jgi:hypothetical protein
MSVRASTVGDQRILAETRDGNAVDLSGLSEGQRVVSPEVIRRLCAGSEAGSVDPRGIRIGGAHIMEPLDLSFCIVPHPVRFEATTFDVAPNLEGAQLPALSLRGCSLPGLRGVGLRLDGDLGLQASEITGEVLLLGAKIGGNIAGAGAALRNDGGDALSADNAEINGQVLLRHGFSAIGTLRLPGTKIGGTLDCDGAALSNEGGVALFADDAEIKGGVFLRHGFNATGTLWLPGARIGGNLECDGATLSNEGGLALVGDGAEINGNVFLRYGFSATGVVWLLRARIGGDLDCERATLSNEDGLALVADGAEIGGYVFLREGFNAIGGVRLSGVKVGRDLDCARATISHPSGVALLADAAEIHGSVFLRDGFNASGVVTFINAEIGGDLDCREATIVNRNGVDPIALVAQDATIGRGIIFRDVHISEGVDLSRASTVMLMDDLGAPDDPLGSWRGVDPLILDGFTYARFAPEAEQGSRLRSLWLKHTRGYRQALGGGFQQTAWQHLIEVYRSQGRDDEATRVAIAMQNDRLERGGLPRYRRWARRSLGLFIGHGYRPWLAGIWAAAVIAVFAAVVWHWSEMFVPAKQGVMGSPQPVAYSTDVFLPIVDLGQAGDWTPTGWMRWVDWTVILLGWGLTTIFVAGFTRMVRNE